MRGPWSLIHCCRLGGLGLALVVPACTFVDEYEGLETGLHTPRPQAEASGSSSSVTGAGTTANSSAGDELSSSTTGDGQGGTMGSGGVTGTGDGGATGSDVGGDTTGDKATVACGEDWVNKDATVPSIMGTWGAPCVSDDDCKRILGADDGMCVLTILGAYEFPQGYCSRPCSLPTYEQSVEVDARDCDPAGGLNCVGAKGIFEACVVPCSNDDQCDRKGYGCVSVPVISGEGDPLYCLMNEDTCCLPGFCYR